MKQRNFWIMVIITIMLVSPLWVIEHSWVFESEGVVVDKYINDGSYVLVLHNNETGYEDVHVSTNQYYNNEIGEYCYRHREDRVTGPFTLTANIASIIGLLLCGGLYYCNRSIGWGK